MITKEEAIKEFKSRLTDKSLYYEHVKEISLFKYSHGEVGLYKEFENDVGKQHAKLAVDLDTGDGIVVSSAFGFALEEVFNHEDVIAIDVLAKEISLICEENDKVAYYIDKFSKEQINPRDEDEN